MLYEYRCTECGHVFPRNFLLAANPLKVECGKCGAIAERFFGTVPPICFKGQGWAGKRELDAHDPKNDNPLDLGDPYDPGDIPT